MAGTRAAQDDSLIPTHDERDGEYDDYYFSEKDALIMIILIIMIIVKRMMIIMQSMMTKKNWQGWLTQTKTMRWGQSRVEKMMMKKSEQGWLAFPTELTCIKQKLDLEPLAGLVFPCVYVNLYSCFAIKS